ncbi:MAG TPA: hypothetical protein VG165_15940 [Solirubrobacteraceae bacterium]|jgi:hypothetical protein|nr:hypothetical protein [Solirubrobacteraceae bacterium]
MSEIDERHRALLGTLIAHGVRFVLVGGVALQLRGFSGATRDVDVTIAAGPLNARLLDQALVALRARPYLAGERGSAYHTEFGQLEVMRWTDGVGDYDAWTRHATTIELEPGLNVRVGSASDLLLAKEGAARAKDTDALPQIRAELLASGALEAADVRGPVAAAAIDVVPDSRVEALLGPRPSQRRQRGLWDHAAQLVEDYVGSTSVPRSCGLMDCRSASWAVWGAPSTRCPAERSQQGGAGTDTVETLILDLLEWVGPGARPYDEVSHAERLDRPWVLSALLRLP